MSAPAPPGVFVHPAGLCESRRVGPGTRIWAFAHVMEGARVGADCNLGDHTFVEAGACLGDRVTLKNGVAVWDRVELCDDVFVGPYAVFTNDLVPRARPFRTDPGDLVPTRVCAGATIGANATVVCGVVVGEHALVGAGSVVTRPVAPHAVVMGSPARQVGWICRCGRRLDDPAGTVDCACGVAA